ncbi:MAG: POTRA domain-containing protein [Candidatus Pseudobacter hemicellulosilyticus]|uniref:POTRA domain-containing protein n=1 Tax=Candidatus Pseudobacter hemicellulosilyticus TaxID=3121375 RepID=A0AAJ5WST9_9BACT|nr:MAG: POTRA domain-containing protein [Pseudobacter sp.]
MQRTFTSYATLIFLLVLFSANAGFAQETDTLPTSVDPELEAILTSRNPKEYIIAGISVTGTKRYDEQLLISIAGINVGDKVVIPGGDNFSKAITNLWNQRLFSNVQIYFTKLEGSNLSLEIHVTERPALSKYFFKGIRKSDEDDLKNKINLVVGRVVTDNVKMSATELIQKYYTEKGFQSASVKIDETPDPALPNSVILTFNVEKGHKVRIDEVRFFGNQAVNQMKLKKQMKGTKEMTRITLFPTNDPSPYGVVMRPSASEYLEEMGFLSLSRTKDFIDPYFRFKLFSSAKFNDKKYLEDKEKLLEYYNSQGYRDAAILADTTYYNIKGNLKVDLKVDEGHKYYFGNINWKGNTKYPDSILNMLLGIQKGDVYNLETLNKKLGKQMTQEGGDIGSLYMDDGYLFFQVDPVETAVYNDTIDFEIRMREGPQATIKNVTIAGNEKTKEHVVRREIRTLPGDKFSRSDLIRSQREISQLGFFNQEKIGINPVPNQEDGTVDINYTLEEKSSDQLELSAGWGGGIGLTGTVGVSFNNFSIRNIFNKQAWDPLPTGDGQKLSLRVQSNGRAFQSYNFSFTEPWLGGKKRNSLTVSLSKTMFRNAGFQNNRYVFSDTNKLKSFSATVSLGKQLKWPDDYFTLIYSVSFTQYKLRNYALFNVDFDNGTSNNLSFKLALARNSAGPNPMFPTTGSNFLASVALTPPYSLFNKSITNEDSYQLPEFHKWRMNAEWFIPIGKAMGADRSRQFVLRAAAKYGFMGRYNKNLNYSPFERFQVGDAGLANGNFILGYDIIAHRGYPVYETSDPKVNPDQQNASQFFTIFNKYTLELRYPFTTNPSSTIYGMLWFEAANGWYDYKEYNPFRLRRSAGVGMRFFLPMFGLLGFDYGVGFDRLNPGGRLRDAARFTFMLGFEPE